MQKSPLPRSPTLTVSLTQAGEVYVCSSFLGRHEVGRSELRYVPPGEMIPLEQPPRADPSADLRRAVGHAVVGREEAFHRRPQALVFDADGRDWEAAREWVLGLVACGIGQPVQELRVARASGAWIMAAARCMRTVVSEDVVDVTGWLPPWERDDENEVVSLAGDWSSEHLEPVAHAPHGTGPVVAADSPDGAGPVVAADSQGPDAACPPTPVEAEALEDWGLVDTGAGVGAWPLFHGTGMLVLGDDGCVVLAGGRIPRPPSPPVSHCEREPGGAPVFWPRRHPASPPVAPPQGVIGPSASCSPGGAIPTVTPPRAFAGWAADGRELYRTLLPLHVYRPIPLRVAASAPLGTPTGAPRVPSPSPHVPCACGLDELDDDDVRTVRTFGRDSGRGGGGGGWAAMALGAWHRFRSAALWPLEFLSPSCRYATARAVHEPPD